MWTKQCLALTLRKKQCQRRSLWAIWTFRHQGESFKSPAWIELCGHHLHFDGVVSTMDIRHHTKPVS